MIMNKFLLKTYSFVFLFLVISKPLLSAEGIEYKHFLGITLDEKFWVLIAFILFILVVIGRCKNIGLNPVFSASSMGKCVGWKKYQNFRTSQLAARFISEA